MTAEAGNNNLCHSCHSFINSVRQRFARQFTRQEIGNSNKQYCPCPCGAYSPVGIREREQKRKQIVITIATGAKKKKMGYGDPGLGVGNFLLYKHQKRPLKKRLCRWASVLFLWKNEKRHVKRRTWSRNWKEGPRVWSLSVASREMFHNSEPQVYHK